MKKPENVIELLVLGPERGGVYQVPAGDLEAQCAEACSVESPGSESGCIVLQYDEAASLLRARVYRVGRPLGDVSWARSPQRWYLVRSSEGQRLAAANIVRDPDYARLLAAHWAASGPDRGALVLSGVLTLSPDLAITFAPLWSAGPDSD